MRAAPQHDFSQIPRADVPRSAFNRSHGLKTTFKETGFLYPVLVEEIVPGDTMNCRMHTFCRMATPVFPVMDNLYLDSFFFFVPSRLLWTNFKKFHGEQDDPGDSTSFTIPQVPLAGGTARENKLEDHMGIPVRRGAVDLSVNVNALPFRAYNLIYKEWFRPQDLIDSPVINMGDGPDLAADYDLLRRAKRHDYFTSCQPWPQKGTAISLPLGTSAPVVTDGSKDNPVFTTNDTNTASLKFTSGSTTESWSTDPLSTGNVHFNLGSSTGLEADLSTATAATINQLRQAFQLQILAERDSRGGTRYTEIVRSHFGVTSPDARQMRPEYLGGGSQQVNITPVPVTSSAGRGELSAYATTAGSNHSFIKSFTEHGFVIGLVSIRADLTYSQGLDRKWSRLTRFDHYYPALAHIGEQSVLNKEIWMNDDANDALVFGYQERFAEMRYSPSRLSGTMRTEHTLALDQWTIAQHFTTLPTLGETFIEENAPVERLLAVGTEDHWLFDAHFEMMHVRPMPTYGVPGLIDHF